MKSVIYSFNTSTGFKCYDPELSLEENQWAYGRWATKEGLGCNFRVGYEVAQALEITSSYKEAADSIDHKFLNNDLAWFEGKATTPEKVAEYLFNEASSQLKKRSLYLTAYPDEGVYINSEQITLIKKYQFLSRVTQIYLTKKLNGSDRVIDRGALETWLTSTKSKVSKVLVNGQEFSELCEAYFKVLQSEAFNSGIDAELGLVCFYDKKLFYQFGKTSPVIINI